MRFIKMHGIGNDYVYINGFEQQVDDPASLAPVLADRHTGVGGDGLILVLPPDEDAKQQGAQVRMRMFNADGSEAEMCGNGVRCVCKLAFDHHVTPGIRDTTPMRVQTGAGILSLDYTLGDDMTVETVTVDMGEPTLAADRVPVSVPGHPGDQPVVDVAFDGWPDVIRQGFAIAGCSYGMTCVSMGNPHVVFYCEDVQSLPLEDVGPVIEHSPLFPNRINAHFVQKHADNEATMRTWERGSGATLACGTGAASVCVAGVLTGQTWRNLLTHLPGGDLVLEWRASDNRVYMTGPAVEVFTGELSLKSLPAAAR